MIERLKRILFLCLLVSAVEAGAQNISVQYQINTQIGKQNISPYIFGTLNGGYQQAPFRIMGGNRMSNYNWENNASNAGSSYLHQSDDYMAWLMGFTPPQSNQAGKLLRAFQDSALAHQSQSAITLPMAGYVAKDKNGTVSLAETAPSSRWAKVVNQKGSAFSLNPDTNDAFIYVDELLHFLINQYGLSSSANGIKNYILDHSPGLWQSDHPRIHPDTNHCVDFIQKSIALSKTVKTMDAQAKVFGPEAYGFYEYYAFQDAVDWPLHSSNYPYFISMYLDSMKKASTLAGKRLLDVLSLHWYPNSNIGWMPSEDTSLQMVAERLQFPRSFWDSTYVEPSWIGQYFSGSLPILHTLKKQISQYYPGTKLGVTEYDFGADSHISGGIAQVEALMGFIKTGTEYACKSLEVKDYTLSAMQIFNQPEYPIGLTSVHANSLNKWASSIVATVRDSSQSELHLIVTNKDMVASINANFQINSGSSYDTLIVYSFKRNQINIQKQVYSSFSLNNGSFNHTLSSASVYHFVLKRKAWAVSIEEPIQNEWTLYPNPAHDKIVVKCSENVKHPEWQIRDLGGQVVSEGLMHSNQKIQAIDITSLPDGVYMMYFGSKQEMFVKE